MEHIMFSIIIPVYNSNKYLDTCINSVLSQTECDYEIILVNDGSADNSGEICEKYATRYPFISVIHQVNAGASSARNTGLKIAKGEYVIFLDSDDFWIDEHALEHIKKMAVDGPDIIIFASKNLYEESNKYIDDRYTYDNILNELDPLECLKYMISHDRFNLSPVKRAMRIDFLRSNNLYFKVGIRCEDIDLGIRIADCLPTYRFINKKMYVYRHHEGSVTTTIGEKHILEYISIIEEFADREYTNLEVKAYLSSYVGYQLALLLAYITSIKPPKYKELLNKMKKYVFLFDYTEYPRTAMIRKFYKIFGYKLTCLCLGYYMRKGH